MGRYYSLNDINEQIFEDYKRELIGHYFLEGETGTLFLDYACLVAKKYSNDSFKISPTSFGTRYKGHSTKIGGIKIELKELDESDNFGLARLTVEFDYRGKDVYQVTSLYDENLYSYTYLNKEYQYTIKDTQNRLFTEILENIRRKSFKEDNAERELFRFTKHQSDEGSLYARYVVPVNINLVDSVVDSSTRYKKSYRTYDLVFYVEGYYKTIRVYLGSSIYVNTLDVLDVKDLGFLDLSKINHKV